MFGLVVVKGSWRAKSPVFHGGNEKTGSVVLLNRERFLTENGVEEIPIISGNAVRGILRREIMADFLKQVGYKIDVSTKNGQKLYHALFTGGILETVDSSSSGVIDIDLKKKVIQYLIPVRLFGFSIGNQTVESKLKVGQGLSICKELSPFLPENINARHSYYEMLTQAFQTRKDELHAEREEDEQAVQMLVEYEVFAPGSMFYHEFKIEDPEDIDLSCFSRLLELWQRKPYIGGKSSIGFGELQLHYDFNYTSEQYLKFLQDNKDKINEILAELEGK